LARHWEPEFETLCELVARAAVVYMDETGWKIGQEGCSLWVFASALQRVFVFGCHKDAKTLDAMLPEAVFERVAVSDDAAVYRQRFAWAQKCWAHLLRKAIRLALLYPRKKSYQRFLDRLLALYYDAKRAAADGRLGTEAKCDHQRAGVVAGRSLVVHAAKRGRRGHPLDEPWDQPVPAATASHHPSGTRLGEHELTALSKAAVSFPSLPTSAYPNNIQLLGELMQTVGEVVTGFHVRRNVRRPDHGVLTVDDDQPHPMFQDESLDLFQVVQNVERVPAPGDCRHGNPPREVPALPLESLFYFVRPVFGVNA
jgi:hypothetical protein